MLWQKPTQCRIWRNKNKKGQRWGWPKVREAERLSEVTWLRRHQEDSDIWEHRWIRTRSGGGCYSTQGSATANARGQVMPRSKSREAFRNSAEWVMEKLVDKVQGIVWWGRRDWADSQACWQSFLWAQLTMAKLSLFWLYHIGKSVPHPTSVLHFHF